MLLNIILYVILVAVGCVMLIPIGNENSTVRRLPWVTFVLMALNVIIYYVSLPAGTEQSKDLMNTQIHLIEFVQENGQMLADEKVRNKLKEIGFLSEGEIDDIEEMIKQNPDTKRDYEMWLNGPDAAKLREEFDKLITDFKAAASDHIYYKYGIAPAGKWKAYQLITWAFMHGGTLHLFFNLIFFFAVGFSLEDLWGRGVFLSFYLLSAMASALPAIINPASVPWVGASGAISATMGAFLIRLPRVKIKIVWISMVFSLIIRLLGKKPYGVIMVAAYIYIPFYFVTQILTWYYTIRVGGSSDVAYMAHFAGFAFGVAFALVMKATRAEEQIINPKIEAKVTFSASPAVTSAIEMLDRGETPMAERKLKAHLAKNPDDAFAILALIQVYQKTLDYNQINAMYGRLIRYHLEKQDKEAALYAYDNLLSSFPDNAVNVQIPVRDWLTICEYLREVEMNREAGVEYERLATAHPSDSLTVIACVQGGEAALLAHDNKRALKLFEQAKSLNPPTPLASRIEAGLQKCNMRLDNRPKWVKQPRSGQDLASKLQEQNLNWGNWKD
jgi:membrane associated rhomboid family serine protease